MCGIAGWAFGRADDDRLRRALAVQSHRGPDGEGVWTSPRASLGHRRLAIIDLSERAGQPMGNEDGTVQVTFNGEIYNFKSLRRLLERKHQFRSDGDTEVLVHGYEEWGIGGLLERISGMFAFAIWDERRGVVHLARDRIGKKPLYYSEQGGVLRFASTLPSLLELLPSTPGLRADAVADYLQFLCVPGDAAVLQGVRKLLPGCYGSSDGGQLAVQRYWRLSFAQQEHRPDDDWTSLVGRELQRATADRLEADVPVGVFLSGGVDSSLVAAAAIQAGRGRVTTISAGFDEGECDELEYARLVAERLGTRHHEHRVRLDAAADLPRLVHSAGEPLADAALLPTMHLSRVAREHVTVVLTGDGGDEGFAGYASTQVARVARAYVRLLPRSLRQAALPRVLRRLGGRGGKVGRAARKLRRLAEAGRDRFEWRFDNLAEKGFRDSLSGLLHPSLKTELGDHDGDAAWRRALAEADGPTDVDRVLHLELVTQLPDLFLTKTDAASMAFGLEARSPFLDAGLLELAARIPAAVKLRRLRSKALLKALALQWGLPRRAILRRKHGFSVPVDAWLRGPLAGVVRSMVLDGLARREVVDRDMVARLLAEHAAGVRHGERLWALLLLELWLRMFVDRTLRPTDILS